MLDKHVLLVFFDNLGEDGLMEMQLPCNFVAEYASLMCNCRMNEKRYELRLISLMEKGQVIYSGFGREAHYLEEVIDFFGGVKE